jgi:hypothetical protein
MWYAGMDRFHMREILGAPVGGYEDYGLLGCDAL